MELVLRECARFELFSLQLEFWGSFEGVNLGVVKLLGAEPVRTPSREPINFRLCGARSRLLRPRNALGPSPGPNPQPFN